MRHRPPSGLGILTVALPLVTLLIAASLNIICNQVPDSWKPWLLGVAWFLIILFLPIQLFLEVRRSHSQVYPLNPRSTLSRAASVLAAYVRSETVARGAQDRPFLQVRWKVTDHEEI